MEVKRFRGSDMREALARVKRELGNDAVILHTKTGSSAGMLGVGKRPYVEILASKDVAFLDKQKEKAKAKTPKLKVPVQENKIKQAYQTVKEETVAPAAVREESLELDKTLAKYNSDLLVLREDMLWIKSTLQDLAKRSKYGSQQLFSDDLRELYLSLMEQEVAEELAMDIVARLHEEFSQGGVENFSELSRSLRKYVSGMLNICEPISLVEGKTTKVALIGPTGVGKTTTIAKLAADFALVRKKKVSVITIDTYRIAAVEQIKTYMDIIDIPLEVVTTPLEMKEAMARQSHSDIILIDTAGRSQNNKEQLEELSLFLKAANPDQTHLVLSSTLHYKNTMDVIEKFSVVPIDRLLFTKLDEAVNFGLILNVLSKVKTQLSYVTTGQSVPDDIEVADSNKLADLLIGGLKV